MYTYDGHRPTEYRKKEREKIADCTLLLNGQTKQTEQACVCVCIYVF